jgi:DNA ligase 1
MLLTELVRTSAAVSGSRSRNTKRNTLARTLAAMDAPEVTLGVSYLIGQLPQGRIGIGPATIRAAARAPAAASATLTLQDVNATIEHMLGLTGTGSTTERRRLLHDLLARATAEEQDFLTRLALGELRQGALEGVMVEAIARAAECDARDVRRAAMLAGDLARVANVALREGVAGLAQYRLTVGTPIRAMLAQTADAVEAALTTFGRTVLDYKMDGARVQIHKSGTDVAIFSRRLNDVTASVPEIVAAVRDLPARELVLDGEAIALAPDARPRTFQTTMRRFGRTHDVAAMRDEIPLSFFCFDCLLVDGDDLLDSTTDQRLSVLDAVLPNDVIMPRTTTDDPAAASAFVARALAAGHEGIMAKDPAAAYEAGNRGSAWLKVKTAHTLDLVILAAEWGSGRRQGWLSNLHLGARDPASGQFVMLGKTFKGLTDDMLRWQTEVLQELAVARDPLTVYVDPQIVVEIAFNDVQTSPHYPAGLALRFARVKRYRIDKRAEEADTIDTVRALHQPSISPTL